LLKNTSPQSEKADMAKKQWQHLLLLAALPLVLSGCIGASNDTTDEETDDSLACEISTVTTVTVPEVTYTEVDEAAGDNHSLALAQTITINSRVSGSLDKPTSNSACEGYGGAADCDDYYVLSVSEGDEISIVLKKSSSTGGIDFDLVAFNDTAYLDQSVDGVESEALDLTIPAGMDTLRISVQNPVSGTGTYELIVKTPVEPTVITDVPSEKCTSNFNGVITNALTGANVAGVTVNLREGADNKTSTVVETTTTDTDGKFTFSGIESQTYTVEVQLADYITSYYNVELPGQKTIEKTYSLSPTFTGDFRIVLNWGASPADIDARLSGPTANGSDRFTLGYWNKAIEDSTLDRDDVTSYGPETITVVSQHDGEYRFFVRCFNDCAGAGATVTIFNQDGVLHQIEMPDEESGKFWNVFTIDGNTYTEINELTNALPQ
jgi:5-hydroxyisourate hydrolase-like protein (transthyretin family)